MKTTLIQFMLLLMAFVSMLASHWLESSVYLTGFYVIWALRRDDE
jgi:hypothetical protein